MRDHADKRRIADVEGLPVWKASEASPSIDNLVGSTMVLAGGVGGAVGWKAKALGWN